MNFQPSFMWFFIGGVFHCIKCVVTRVDPHSGLPGGKWFKNV